MHYLKQSTASTIKLGPFLNDTDGKTAETGLTIAQADIRLSKNGAAFAQTNNVAGATHDELGWYGVPLDTTDTATTGRLKVAVHESGALPCFAEFMVVPANTYDSLIAGTDAIHADMMQIGGDTQSQSDLKDLVDTGYNPTSHKLLGVVLCDTTTTNTDMRGTDGANTTVPDAAGVAPTAAEIKTAIEAAGSHLALILADTAELQGDWANGGRLDLIIDLILADTAELQGNQAAWATATGFSTHSAADIWSVATRALTDKSGFALSATGANLILKDSTFALAMADAIWDEILSGATHNIASSAGRRVREIGAYAIESGTAQAGATNSITLAATASAVDGTYNRNLIVLVDNTGVGQTRTIVDYNGTTKVAIIDRDWRTTPDATSTYQVTPDNTPLVVDQGVAQAGTATTITLRAYASAVNDIYLCNVVAIIAGTGRGQARLVGGYVGATKVVTICGDNWIANPDATSVYVLMPYGTTCTSCIGTYALGLIKTECDTALTDYDSPTRAEATADKDAIIAGIAALNDITVADIIAGISDGTLDLQEMMRIILAATAGKSSGGGTVTLVFRDAADSKARITATVDANGNRTAMTLDGA